MDLYLASSITHTIIYYYILGTATTKKNSIVAEDSSILLTEKDLSFVAPQQGDRFGALTHECKKVRVGEERRGEERREEGTNDSNPTKFATFLEDVLE